MYQSADFLSNGDSILKDICRLCRTSKGVMSCIFNSPGVNASVPLSTRIMNFANVKVSEGDGLPSLICHRCLYHIETVNEFKEQCEQSDIFLRQLIAKQIEESDQEEVLNNSETLKNSTGVQCDGTDHNFMFGNSSSEIKEEVSEVENFVMVVDPCQAVDDSDIDQHSDFESNGLNCPTCNKMFESKGSLVRHLDIHSQDGLFPCDYCDLVVGDKSSLRFHWRQAHAENKPHLCLTCGEAFTEREYLSEHTSIHDKVKPFHCTEPSCTKAFAYRSDLRKHSVIHTGARPYVCHVCFKSFTRSTNLNKHTRLHTGQKRKPFSCGSCKKMFASRADLVRHSVIHTGVKPYSCAICSLSFNRKDKLSRHEKLHQGDRAHACSECPTSFHRKEELTKHIQFHHYSPPVFDDDDLSDAKDLTEAINGNRSDETSEVNNEENFMPQENSEDQYETEDLIISVDPAHWAGTKNQCDVCHKNFTDPHELSKHRLSHSKSKNFVCEICSKGFHQRRELVRHSVTHTGFKPHSCEICGKAFSRRDKLTRHMRTHLMLEKPDTEPIHLPDPQSTCDVCFKVYSSKHELLRHLLTHSIYKPFQCGLCSAAYCRKDKLAKHIKVAHS